MTVSELIEKLMTMPQDMRVTLLDVESGSGEDVTGIEIVDDEVQLGPTIIWIEPQRIIRP